MHQTIGLYIRSRRKDLEVQLRNLFDFFAHHHIEYLFEQTTHSNLPHQLQETGHELFAADDPPSSISLFVVVGGDGSLLHACQLFYPHRIPVVGINLGTLGFLTDINVDSLEEQLLPILQGEGSSDSRKFLQVSGEHLPVKTLALNDVVVQTGESGRIMGLSVAINGCVAYDLRCDGMILATATGSTAYALSAGGPLLHSGVDAMVLVPLAAHNLATRSSVVPANSKVEFVVKEDSPTALVSVDGQQNLMLANHESVVVQQSNEAITLLHPPNHDFCAAWRVKLGWSPSLI